MQLAQLILHRSLLARGVFQFHLLRGVPTALFTVDGVGERDSLCPFLVYPRLTLHAIRTMVSERIVVSDRNAQ